jgi:hypothetical protein
VAGYRVDWEPARLVAGKATHLSFAVSRGGAPVALQPYLGAYGHLVGFRSRGLDYSHVHPLGREQSTIMFLGLLPRAGRHRLFLQFRAGGTVYTAPFTVDVAPGAGAAPTDGGGGHNH